MKKLILPLLLTVCFPVLALGKTFAEEFVRIYNSAADEKVELIKISPGQILDSLRKEELSAQGEELSDIRKQIELISRVKEMQVAAGFNQASISDERYGNRVERLVSGYEELLKVSKGNTGARLLAKYRRNRIEEVIFWLEIDFSPFSAFPGSGKTDKMASMLQMMRLKMEVIFDLSLARGMTTGEFFAIFGESDPDDPEARQSLSDEMMKLFSVEVDNNDPGDSIILGAWLEEDTLAREWTIKRVDGKHGLYDTSGKAVLSPEYDAIEHFIGFLRTDKSGYHMYILGFELTRGGKKGFADLTGKIIFPPEYDDLVHFEQGRSRYIRLRRDGKQGLADELTGELVVPIEYDKITWRGDYVELKRGRTLDRIGWDRARGKITGAITRSTE